MHSEPRSVAVCSSTATSTTGRTSLANMTDHDVPASDAQQPAENRPVLEQAHDAASAQNTDSKEKEEATRELEPAAPSIPASGDDSNTAPSAIKSETSAATVETLAEDGVPSKGKDKEQPATPAEPAMEKDKDEDDSLQIQPSGQTNTSLSDANVCNITLLLPTGARHPYRIDEKYLSKRNVEIPENDDAGKKDPFSISVYKLKELILREWREEWDGKPASPSSIRLIHFGKLLDDKEQLKSRSIRRDSAPHRSP